MKYVALLRGINAGGNRRVEMQKLKILFEGLDYQDVATYINSGNILFTAKNDRAAVFQEIEAVLEKEFSFPIPFLLKTAKEMQKIAQAIPRDWKNDTAQRTDVAYLFPEIDTERTIDDLPVKKEFLDICYVKGAIFWNVSRKNYNKSHLNKLIGHKLYQAMTVRNVNTARYLGGE